MVTFRLLKNVPRPPSPGHLPLSTSSNKGASTSSVPGSNAAPKDKTPLYFYVCASIWQKRQHEFWRLRGEGWRLEAAQRWTRTGRSVFAIVAAAKPAPRCQAIA